MNHFHPLPLSAIAVGLLASPSLAKGKPLPPTTPTIAADPPQRFGVRAGLNFSSVTGDDVNDSELKSRTGFAFGGYMTYRLSPTVSLQPELYYSMQGAERRSDVGGGTLKLDYIQVPLLVRAQLPISGKVGVHVVGGLAMGILVNAEAKQGGQTVDFKDVTSTFDFGIDVGAGIDVPLDSGGLNFELRYNFGITTVDETSQEAEIKNRVFSLLAGYYF